MKNNIIPAVLSVLSAILLIVCFPPFNLSFLAWIALVPLFSIPKELSAKRTFILYYFAGFIFWLCHIWWINYVTSLGYVVLSGYLALFFGFLGLLLKLFREKTGYPILFIAPPLWIFFEFIRTYFPIIGFPWSLLGYSQWQNISLIQISSITGVYGVSFLIVMINAAIADLVLQKTSKSTCLCFLGFGRQVRNLLLSLLIIITIVIRGWDAIPFGERGGCDCQKFKISVIQGNISQNIKWDEEYVEEIVNTYAELSIYAGKEPNISLMVWPETSYPDYVDTEGSLFQRVRTLTHYLDMPLLLGAITYQNNRDYNSALLILPDGEIKQVYNKIHLVPFAEYIPLKSSLSFLGNIFPQIGNFSEGTEYSIFNVSDGVRYSGSSESSDKNNFATLICFEDVFPNLARKFTKKGADFLIVITNDAHFKQSPALWQHFTHSVFRAVENRRPVVRAANNGISGFIDSYGRPVKILNEKGKATGIRGYATSEILPSSDKTLYTRFGDLFTYLNIIYLGIVLIIRGKKNTNTPDR